MMVKNYSFKEIMASPIMNSTVKHIFDGHAFGVVERPGSFIMLLDDEGDEKVRRIMILKPRGFTSNSANELSSHPEAKEATVEVKGAVRPGRHGYFSIKDCIEFVYYPKSDVEIIDNYPYADADNAWRLIRSSRTRFKVVKDGNYGFYHNMINLTDEWLVLILDKKLNGRKEIDYSSLEHCSESERRALLEFLEAVKAVGDAVFEHDGMLVNRVLAIDPKRSLPALITFLNVQENGRHEQCSVFAVILKVAKKNPVLAIEMLESAAKVKLAPAYYLRELPKKIAKFK